MGENKTYKDYFSIDENFYPAITAKLIEEGKVSWKNYYPHESFINLLENTHAVLSGKQNLSLWVEGAYGTGKSHAALTVKSLLEASDDEVKAYFDDYGLKKELCDKIIADKNNGNMITIHRVGSSSIHSDNDLIIAIQESILAALDKHDIKNHGESSLRIAALNWLEEKEANKVYFASLIADEKYAWKFPDKNIDNIIADLKENNPAKVMDLMRNLLEVARDNNIVAMRLSAEDMANWIRTIIRENHLSAILFIWDEFTEYFHNNRNALTGFQTLVQVSQDSNFFFMIVSHESTSLFASSEDAKKILGRFVPPIKIELPENMAFRLMAQAMKKADNPVLKEEWQEFANDLNEQLITVRQVIVNDAKKHSMGSKTFLKDEDLCNIIPIHPYAALLLKHISVVFASNQRSMFDFILSNDMNAKSFKWFIDSIGPLSNHNLLTVDMLWDFFCVQGKSGLTDSVRTILGAYNIVDNDRFDEDEKRVFKVILLLQSISNRVGNVELLKPNDQNVDLAFSGVSGWREYKGHAIADALEKKQVLFKRPAGNRTEYVVALNQNDNNEIDNLKEEIRKEKKTKNLVLDATLSAALKLPKSLEARLEVSPATVDDFTNIINSISRQDWKYKFPVVLTFAKNEAESIRIRESIEQSIKKDEYSNIIFIDASSNIMGEENFTDYVTSSAYAKYYLKKDGNQAKGFTKQANDKLDEWKSSVENGSFTLYNKENISGFRCANKTVLVDELKAMNLRVYPYALEQNEVVDQMFTKGPLAMGAECGINQELKGAFNASNKRFSLENVVNGAWHVDKYWEDPMKQSLPLVKAKLAIEAMIEKKFKEDGRISILYMFEELRKPKFGYMPCNITAFIMGFLLKEYTQGDFFWSNGLTSTPMTVEKMKGMIANGINQAVVENKKYKEEFLVAMSAEQSAFLKATAKIYRIDPECCGSIEQARDRIRLELRKMPFPLWCVKYALDKQDKLVTKLTVVEEAIDLYCGLANNGNMGGRDESAIANDLGRMFLDNTVLTDDLASLVNADMCHEGMLAFIAQYHNGELVKLAQDIGDNGRYIDQVKKKFNADAANWVWDVITAEEKINRVILEYKIVQESNLSLPKSSKLGEAVTQWNARTHKLHISAESLAEIRGELKPFIEMLYKMKKTGSLLDQDKEQFYEVLTTSRNLFDEMYDRQFECFKEIVKVPLQELSDDDAKQIYASLIDGLFTYSKSDYYRYVEGKVKEYLASQAKLKMRKIWEEKTGTKNPKDWSNRYQTPILCMFDDDDRQKFRMYFNILNSDSPKDEDVKRTIDFIADNANVNIFERLSNEQERDKCFIEGVVGDYAVVLGSANEIRAYLQQNAKTSPYHWFEDKSVSHLLEKHASEIYTDERCIEAIEMVENLNPEELKYYLRELITDNLAVGIQILKGKEK